jgi:hypothetical protein
MIGADVMDQRKIDRMLIELDGTKINQNSARTRFWEYPWRRQGRRPIL